MARRKLKGKQRSPRVRLAIKRRNKQRHALLELVRTLRGAGAAATVAARAFADALFPRLVSYKPTPPNAALIDYGLATGQQVELSEPFKVRYVLPPKVPEYIHVEIDTDDL